MNRTEVPAHTLSTSPQKDATAFVAAGAAIMGDVRLHAEASVWYNAVLRGDINYIEVGERSNIQDLSLLHVENEKPCIVGNDVTVGHQVTLHGCTVEDGCLIGIGAIILSGAVIGKGSIIAAGAVVLENTFVDPFSMMAGVPAKKIRALPESTYETNLKWAAKYVEVAKAHRLKFQTT